FASTTLEGITDDETYFRRRGRQRFPCGCDRADGERAGKENNSPAAEDEGLRRQVEGREGEDRRQGPRGLPHLHERLPEGVRTALAGPRERPHSRTELGLARARYFSSRAGGYPDWQRPDFLLR